MFHLSNHNPILSSFLTYHWECNKSNTAGAASGAGTIYPSRAFDLTPSFQRGLLCSIYSFFCVVFCILLFACLFHSVIAMPVIRYTTPDYPFKYLQTFRS